MVRHTLKILWQILRKKGRGGGGWGGGGVGVEMKGLSLFYYFAVQPYLLCVRGNKGSLYYFSDLQSFELAMQNSDPGFYCTKT